MTKIQNIWTWVLLVFVTLAVLFSLYVNFQKFKILVIRKVQEDFLNATLRRTHNVLNESESFFNHIRPDSSIHNR